MGIGKGPALLLLKESIVKPFHGSILTLGKQEVLISPFQLKRHCNRLGINLELPKNSDPYLPITDKDFFQALGFSDLQTLDYSDYEGASIPFDLNSGETPEKYKDAFDVIYDGGTIEHVFHLPNALKSLVWMLKPGGRIIHFSPAANHLEHGFYMFSPTFFSDYYEANHFQLDSIKIVRCTPCFDYKYKVYDYKSLGLAHTDVGMGRLDHGMYLIHTVATKTERSTSHVVPNQSIYSKGLWSGGGSTLERSLLSRAIGDYRLSKWKQIFKESPLYPLWAYLKLKCRKQGMPLKVSDEF